MIHTVRIAIEEDVPALLRLYREMNPEDPAVPADVANRIWHELTATRGRTVLIAEVDGAPAGTVDCTVQANFTRGGKPILYMDNVVVGAAYRRRGIGRALLDEAARVADDAGCYKLQLLTNADDTRAHAFYRACGYVASASGFRRYVDRT